MESRVKLLGHSVHQQLIAFPFGLLGGASIFDGIALSTKNRSWFETSHKMIGAGLVTGGVAAVFGLIDWLAIPPNTRAKRIGAVHGLGNLVVTGLYAFSWGLRAAEPRRPGSALTLSFIGLGLAAFTGWLGGELVDRLSVGVDDDAHLNSPSSLSNLPASAIAPHYSVEASEYQTMTH